MKNMQISVREYAKLVNKTHSAITKAIREKRQLNGVKRISKIGNAYILTIENKL